MGKKFLGMPMNWEITKMFSNMWNKNESRIFPPKSFGIGWELNFYALFRKIGLLK